MGIAIDIGLIVVVLIYVGIGIYKGFMDSLLKIIGTVGAMVIAVFAARPMFSFVDGLFNHSLSGGLGNLCVEWFCGKIDPALLDPVLTDASKTAFLENVGSGVGDALVKSIVNSASLDSGETIRNVIATGMGTVFGAIIAGVVLFVLIKFLVFLLAKLFDTKEKPVLSGINRALGMVLGAIKGGLFVVVLYTALSISCMVFPIQAEVDDIKNQTTIFKATYNPYSEIVQEFVNDKMGDFVENFTNNLIKNAENKEE